MKKTTILTVNGNGIHWSTNHRGNQKIKNNNNNCKEYDTINSNKKYTPSQMSAYKLEGSRKKRVVRFSRTCSKLKHKAKTFLTLTFDYNVKQWSIDECIDVFNKFRRYLIYNFPECWFLYAMEYKNTAGFHYHLLGCFNSENLHGDNAYETRKNIKEKWLRLICSDNISMMKGKKADHEKHFGYITKPDKAQEMRMLIKELNGRHLFGVINKKHLPQYDKVSFEFDDQEWENFKIALEKELLQSTDQRPAIKEITRLLKSNNCLNYLSRDIIKNALKEIGIKLPQG